MITLKHYHDGDYHWTVTETDRGRTYLRNTYAMGWDKPNYPMPAIPLAVAIHPDLIQIAEVYWHDEWLETQDTLPIQMAEFELVYEYP